MKPGGGEGELYEALGWVMFTRAKPVQDFSPQVKIRCHHQADLTRTR
jgi:hypothetical protein